jgi:hypothetical protein
LKCLPYAKSKEKSLKYVPDLHFTAMSSDLCDENEWIDVESWEFTIIEDANATEPETEPEIETIIAPIRQSSSLRTAKHANKPRKNYGTGIDAKRTSSTRRYPAAQSRVLRLLAQYGFPTLKADLLQLINDALKNCPENERPQKPSRSQKRVKNGLVQWMDINEQLMEQYITTMITTR